jgi:hypothetical protein
VIAFVAVGRTPSYVTHAIDQARDSNPDAPVVLLMEGALRRWQPFARARDVELYDLTRLRRDAAVEEFYRRREERFAFRGGFWQHTTGRFLVLRAFMERERLDALTHLENDVLLYAPLASLSAWAPFAARALGTVFESGDRAIPGMVHVGARSALDRFAQFILATTRERETNDMELFAAFRRATSGTVVDFPTVLPGAGGAGTTRSLFADDAPTIPMAPGGWLFDGARFGQYLGGIDPRNAASRVQRWLRRQEGGLARPNGFINESCIDDPSRYAYEVSRPAGHAVPTVVAIGRQFPLATLHVHSKKLPRFMSRSLDAATGGTSTVSASYR